MKIQLEKEKFRPGDARRWLVPWRWGIISGNFPSSPSLSITLRSSSLPPLRAPPAPTLKPKPRVNRHSEANDRRVRVPTRPPLQWAPNVRFWEAAARRVGGDPVFLPPPATHFHYSFIRVRVCAHQIRISRRGWIVNFAPADPYLFCCFPSLAFDFPSSRTRFRFLLGLTEG